MVIWKLVFRSLAQRPGRAILTLLSVVCGVAAVVSVWIASETSTKAYENMTKTVSGNAALEVVAKLGDDFEEAILEEIDKVPGVENAGPVAKRGTNVTLVQEQSDDESPDETPADEPADDADTQKKKVTPVRATILGVDPVRENPTSPRAIRSIDLVDGKYFEVDANGELVEEGVLLESELARKLKAKVGDEVKVKTSRGSRDPLKVLGVFKPQGAAAFSQSAVLLMPLGTAQYRLKREGYIDNIQIVLQEKADVAQVRQAIAAILPETLRVRAPETRSSTAEETSLSTKMGLSLGWAFSMVVALFIIMNTFLMNVSERRRQLAIMRAIGAKQSQIGGLLCREALLLGIVGTVLGSFAGVGFAELLTKSLGNLYQTELPTVSPGWEPFVVGGLFGIGISLVGALIPAWLAMRLSPLEAMSAAITTDGRGKLIGLTILGVVICIGAVTVIQGTLVWNWPIGISVWATVMLLLGFVMLLPAVLGIVSGVIEVLLRAFPAMRVEITLARRQLLRQRIRTTLTIGVLFVAVTTGTALTSNVMDTVNNVRNWKNQVLKGDFYIRATAPNMQNTESANLPDELVQEVERLRQTGLVRTYDTIRHFQSDIEGQDVLFIARDFPTAEEMHFDFYQGKQEELFDRMCQGEVVAGSVTSQRLNKGVDDEIDFPTPTGPKKLRIAAVVNDYMGGGLTLYMRREQANQIINVTGVDVLIVKVEKQKLAQAEKTLRALCDRNEVLLQSNAGISQTIDGMMSGVVASLYVLVALIVIVAAFGVVNTLTMNVLEQTRQLGMLRIVAMTRWQVRKLILAQAAIIGLTAVPTAVLLGMRQAYWINQSMMPVLGHPVRFDLHPDMMAIALVGTLFVVLVAASLPARRAANLDLLTAMHYE